jgi:replicative DNA helicase
MIDENPNSEHAERNLIGLTLLEKRIPDGALDLRTTDFYWPQYRAAWSAFLEIAEEGREIEPFSAAEIIKRNGQEFTVFELTQTTNGMIHLNEKVFVNKIKQAATRRYLIRELNSSIQQLSAGEMNLSGLKRKLDNLETAAESTGNFKSLADILETEVRPALADLRQGILHRIKTGFDKIDTLIGGGLSSSDVVVVAANTGAGKSAFVMQIASNIAKQNIPVAYVSGEMSNKENGLRFLSQISGFYNLNSTTHLSEDDLDFLMHWLEHTKQFPIYFDSTTFDLQSMSKSLRALVQEHGVKVLVIDYLQLFRVNKYDRQTRTERIAECSQEVKRIAMEFGIAVIEVVQFNREGSKSIKSSMHDLEGSSQLEKDASLIFIIDREEDSSEINLRLVKGRNAAKTQIPGIFRGMTLNFEF